MRTKLLPALLGAMIASIAMADEAAVKKSFESRFERKAESITKAGYLGLYEVYTDGQIIYSDEKGSVFIIPDRDNGLAIVDSANNRNVTKERLKKLTAVKWSELPLENAFKQVRGNGKRLLATFEDPNCGYCKRLAKDLQKLDNVTVYTFLLPILSQDSIDKSKAIWCASDRAKAWNDWMVEGKAPSGKTDCDTTAITRNQEFGRKLNINGTPTMFFADGERIPGAVPLQKIEEKLAQTAGK